MLIAVSDNRYPLHVVHVDKNPHTLIHISLAVVFVNTSLTLTAHTDYFDQAFFCIPFKTQSTSESSCNLSSSHSSLVQRCETRRCVYRLLYIVVGSETFIMTAFTDICRHTSIIKAGLTSVRGC